MATPVTEILNLDDKIKLIARDLIDHSILLKSTHLPDYKLSTNLLAANVVNENEYMDILKLLERKKCIVLYPNRFEHASIFTIWDVGRPIKINKQRLNSLINLKSPSQAAEQGFIDTENNSLIINGATIYLGRNRLDKTYQYWIATICTKSPGKPIDELTIIEKKGEDPMFAKRPVRDAANKLNKKIFSQTGVAKLFLYKNGTVTFRSQILD